MPPEILEAKFRFIRDNAFLIARVNVITGKQQLVMQKIDPATGVVDLEEAIDCIHTAVTAIPAEDLAKSISDPGFEESMLMVRSSENLKEVKLDPQKKFIALRSWVAGIAEAGVASFLIQSEIENISKLAYPIATRLMNFV